MCEDIRGSARIYEDERGYMRVCEDLRGYARIYEDRRGCARIYEGARIRLPNVCQCVISTICFSFAFWGGGCYHFETITCCSGIVWIAFALKLGERRPGGMRGAFK